MGYFSHALLLGDVGGGGGSGVQYMYENGIICILSSAVSHMENMDDVFGVVRLSFVCRH